MAKYRLKDKLKVDMLQPHMKWEKLKKRKKKRTYYCQQFIDCNEVCHKSGSDSDILGDCRNSLFSFDLPLSMFYSSSCSNLTWF